MVASDPKGDQAVRTSAQFTTTQWSVVLAAADSSSPEVDQALERLCQTYWYPLYAFVRLNGHSPEEAADLTQAFFERFLKKRQVKVVAREKGRFRSFLLTVLRRFLCDDFHRATAAKRGGGVPVISLDADEAEAQLDQAFAFCQAPELMFDRAWAETVVQTCVERLRAQYEAEGKGSVFRELRRYLSRPADRSAYQGPAQRLGMSADAVSVAVMRLRRRYRELVRAEVAHTVATPAEIDDEMRYLVDVLSH